MDRCSRLVALSTALALALSAWPASAAKNELRPGVHSDRAVRADPGGTRIVEAMPAEAELPDAPVTDEPLASEAVDAAMEPARPDHALAPREGVPSGAARSRKFLRSVLGHFSSKAAEEPPDEIESDLGELTSRLKALETLHYSPSVRGTAEREDPESLSRARALSRGALEKVLRGAQAEESRGWSGWAEAGWTRLWGELREKMDVKASWRALKELLATEGKPFFIYAVCVEAFEDVVLPVVFAWMGRPELIPFALGLHLEPAAYPLYFAARWYLRNRRLWSLAGGRGHYRRLADFRARLMNENPARRIERIFLGGFPSASEHQVIMLNVNRSRLPGWVPLFLRNLYDRDFRWYDLYISVNELAALAPRSAVRRLRRYYRDYPRAVSHVLIQSIIDGPAEAKARFIQNLAFKYWLNVGFDDFQPTLLRFLDPKERELAERNRSFAGRFLSLATKEEARAIKTFVADIYAWTAIRRATDAAAPDAVTIMAPFLLGSYPRADAPFAGWVSSPLALARAHGLLAFIASQGAFTEGETIMLGDAPIARLERGRVEYVGELAPFAERAVRRYASSLEGAAEFLRRYRLETGRDPFSDLAPPRDKLDFAEALGPEESQLLLKIYWLKRAAIPRRMDALRAEAGADRRSKREGLAELRRLRRRLDELEVLWLKDYFARRFVLDEEEVPSYAETVERLRKLEALIPGPG